MIAEMFPHIPKKAIKFLISLYLIVETTSGDLHARE